MGISVGAVHQQAQEAFLDPLRDVVCVRRDHVGQARAPGLDQHLLVARLTRRTITKRRAQAADTAGQDAVPGHVGDPCSLGQCAGILDHQHGEDRAVRDCSGTRRPR